MEVAADTAAVMVTHNGERFIRQQCESIFRQSLLPAVVVVVDDASTDETSDDPRETRSLGRRSPWRSSAVDSLGDRQPQDVASQRTSPRGLAAVSEYEVVLLSDQDDEWLVDRLASQREILRRFLGGLLVAGDGLLIDECGDPIGGRLRDSFPPPEDWAALDAAGRMRAALRRPFVTGAASALTAETGRLMTPVPRGWLHDRWATLVAAARNGLVLQNEPVIRYRVHDGQTLGAQAGCRPGRADPAGGRCSIVAPARSRPPPGRGTSSDGSGRSPPIRASVPNCRGGPC